MIKDLKANVNLISGICIIVVVENNVSKFSNLTFIRFRVCSDVLPYVVRHLVARAPCDVAAGVGSRLGCRGRPALILVVCIIL